MSDRTKQIRPTITLRESAAAYGSAQFTGLTHEQRTMLNALLGTSFERTFQYTSFGMVLSDMQGNYIAANPALCRMLEYTEPELLGCSYTSFTHPDDVQRTESCRQQVVTGESLSYTIEKRYIAKSGRIVTVIITATLVTTSANEPLWLIGHVQDISSLRHSEEALLTSEARYRAVVEEQTELICRCLPDTTLTFVNDAYCRYFGRSANQLLGTSFLLLVPAEVRDAPRELWQDLARNPRESDATHQVLDRNGMTCWQEWTNRPIMDAQGRVIEFQSVGRDITRRKEAEDSEREQRRLAEVLCDTAAALSSTLDYDRVLDRLLENAQQVVHFDAVNILQLNTDSDEAIMVRAHGYAEHGLSDWVQQLRLKISDMPYLQKMMATGQPIVIPDTRADASWVRLAGDEWIRSFAGLPILVKGQHVGIMGFDSSTPGFFQPSTVARLQTFADQAAIAIENARLYQTERRHVERLTLLHQASLELAHTDTLPDLYREILHWGRMLAATNIAALSRVENADSVVVVATAGVPQDIVGNHFVNGEGMTGTAASTRAIQQTHDYSNWSGSMPEYAQLGVWGAIALPLLWQDRLIGVLTLSDVSRKLYDAGDMDTLELYASLVAAALEQRMAVMQAHERAAEANALSVRLSRAQEEERVRIAGQLHDSIGYRLVEFSKTVEVTLRELGEDHPEAERLGNSLALAHETHEMVRTLATDLNARSLADLGLAPTARQYVQRLAESTGADIRIYTTGRSRRMPADIERVAYRSMQECLMNALRHAHATTLSAHIHFGGRVLRLTVQDNGQGFDPDVAINHGTVLGLPEIRRQVQDLHGSMLVDSMSGHGAVIEITLPLRGAQRVEKSKARVLVVDDHATTRGGLRMLLGQSVDFVCIGEASDGMSAVNLVDMNRPELVIMDIRMPGLTGIDAMTLIKRRFPQVGVVILTSYEEEAYLQQALQSGAHGFVLKTDDKQCVLDALRAAQKGEIYVSPQLRATWERLQRTPLTNDPLAPLSIREREVFRMVVAGLTTRQTAQQIGLSNRTVEVYRRSIKNKLGLKRLAQWMDFAARNGLLER